MNQDEIIEAEVEKAERRYWERIGTAPAPGPWFEHESRSHYDMDLQEIAELYGFDPRTGEYVINAGGWCAPTDVPQMWSLSDDVFDAILGLNLDRKHRIDDPRFVR